MDVKQNDRYHENLDIHQKKKVSENRIIHNQLKKDEDDPNDPVVDVSAS